MEESNVYKRMSMSSARDRQITNLTSDENTKVQNILNNFRTFFVDKHSS